MTNSKGAQMEATPIQAIDQRIEDLTQQRAVLLAELDALYEARSLISEAANGNGSQADSPLASGFVTPKPKTRRTTKTRAKAKAKTNGHRTGQRQQGILDALKYLEEGVTIPELANELGMTEPNYLYRALPRLQAQGRVQSTGKPPRWTLAQ